MKGSVKLNTTVEVIIWHQGKRQLFTGNRNKHYHVANHYDIREEAAESST